MQKTIVFDLDDTLVKEVEYLKSAFRQIAKHCDASNETLFDEMFAKYRAKEDAFGMLIERYDVSKDELKLMYRNHKPDFSGNNSIQILQQIKDQGHNLGLVTDGFSITQRNKIKALGIEDLFDLIVVSEEFGSEKPTTANFEVFHQFGTEEYYYVSDNLSKDFIAPNSFGWKTVCLLDDGDNIHRQDFDKEAIYLPTVKIDSLNELLQFVNK